MTTAASYSNLVQDLYVAYFGRPADYYGLQSFESALAAADAPTDAGGLLAAYNTNAAVKSLVDSFGTSAESTALYGSGSTASFVNAVFENLFNRSAAVSGLSFWVDAIDSGQVSKGDAALAILAGAFANNSTQGQADQNTINNKVAVAGNFTTDLGASSYDIVAYHGSTAAAAARLMLAGVTGTTDIATYDVITTINTIVDNNNANTYTLTTGIDTLVGGPGNDVFNATLGGSAPTLQAFDSITGGTLHNTLNINDFGEGGVMAIPGSATITGITTLNINSLETVGSDFSSWNTLANLNVKSTNGASVTVGDSVVVSVSNSTAGDVYVNGGSAITVNQTEGAGNVTVAAGVGATSLTVDGGAQIIGQDGNWGKAGQTLASATLGDIPDGGSATLYSDALSSLSIVNSMNSTVTVDTDSHAGARTLNVTLDGDINVTVKDDQAGTLDFTTTADSSTGTIISAASATSLVFNDNALANYGEIAAPHVKTVTITGAGDFSLFYPSLAAGAMIDASGSSGTVTVAMPSMWGNDPTASFIGGSGQDFVDIEVTQTGSITGGSAQGNEIAIEAMGGPAEYATEAVLASVTNFQDLAVGGETYGTFDMANLKGQSYTGFEVDSELAGNVVFKNVTPDSNLSLTLVGACNFVVELDTADKAGASDTVNLTLGGDYPGDSSVSQLNLSDATQDGIGTINLISNSMSISTSSFVNTIHTLGDSGLVTLNLSGNTQLEIDSLTITGTSLTISNSAPSLGLGDLNAGSLTALTLSGSGNYDIANLETSASSLVVTDNSSGSVSIDSLNAGNLKTATFTESVDSSSASLTIGGLETSISAFSTLNLNGNVAIVVGNDSVTTGVTVAGATDNSDVTFYGAGGSASGVADSVTLGNGDDFVFFSGGVTGSTQTITLGNGTDTVLSQSTGTVNITVGSGNDAIDLFGASALRVTAGNGNNTIAEWTANAAVSITTGTGANNITLTVGDSGTVTLGTHSATTADIVTVGASGTGNAVTPLIAISGLNNGTNGAGLDQIVFPDNLGAAAGITSLTAAQVAAAGGDTTNLANWVAVADSAAFNAPAHEVVTFQFQGNTYLMETVYGGATDAGAPNAQNTLVELVGTGYTFAHTGLGMVNGHAAITLMG